MELQKFGSLIEENILYVRAELGGSCKILPDGTNRIVIIYQDLNLLMN
jgi:hypothetical protein